MSSNPIANSLTDSIRHSHFLRLAILGVLTLILLIPVSMIRGLIAERRDRHDVAAKEVTSKWGGSQVLTGPALILPYTAQSTLKQNAVFLPKRLKTSGVITEEARGRGIFEVPVYSLTAALEGEFEKPRLAELGIDPASVDWSQAYLVIGISDVRALRSQSRLTWNGRETEFLPGVKQFIEAPQGLHAPVSISGQETEIKFSFPVSVNGSESAYVVPFGEETVVQFRSNSPNPNFQGNWLPTDRTVSKNGFDATWRVSYLGRNYPQSWITGANYVKPVEGSRFGVELKDPIDQYRMADRSVKYAGLFIVRGCRAARGVDRPLCDPCHHYVHHARCKLVHKRAVAGVALIRRACAILGRSSSPAGVAHAHNPFPSPSERFRFNLGGRRVWGKRLGAGQRRL